MRVTRKEKGKNNTVNNMNIGHRKRIQVLQLDYMVCRCGYCRGKNKQAKTKKHRRIKPPWKSYLWR